MFYAMSGVMLIIAAAVIWALNRRLGDTEQRAAAAETEAALSWGKGYQAGAHEQCVKLQREIVVSRDKGFETGWNTCVTQFEDRPEYKDTAAA